MTRIGKIARLPKGVREELNKRLQDGESGPGLLGWLNGLAECKRMLVKEFDSRAITKQNLSEWKTGGYEEWLRKEESRQQVQMLVEKVEDLGKEAGEMAIADRLGTVLVAELIRATEQLKSIEDSKERWVRLKDIARELYRLRREDHHGRKLRMAEEQWEIRSKREAKEYERRKKKAEAKRLLKLQSTLEDKPLVASLNGSGHEAWKWMDWTIRVGNGLPMPHWWTNPKTAEEWTKLMMPYWHEQAEKLRGESGGAKISPKSDVQGPSGTDGAQNGSHRRKKKRVKKSGPDKGGQAKSNRVKVGRAKKKSPVHGPQSTVEAGKAPGKTVRMPVASNTTNATNGTNEARGSVQIPLNPGSSGHSQGEIEATVGSGPDFSTGRREEASAFAPPGRDQKAQGVGIKKSEPIGGMKRAQEGTADSGESAVHATDPSIRAPAE